MIQLVPVATLARAWRSAVHRRRGAHRLATVATFAVATFVLLTAHRANAADGATLKAAISEYSAAMELKDRSARLAKFARAEQMFQQCVDQSRPSAELLVNWGNAALQAEHIGSSIVAYRRALLLDPQNVQAQQNLKHARTVVAEWARYDEQQGVIGTLFFWLHWIAPSTALIVGGLCFLIAVSLFAARHAWPAIGKRIKLLQFGFVFVWLLMLILSAAHWWNSPTSDHAVVTAAEAILYSADSENSPHRSRTPLPDGAEVRVLTQREKWLEVELAGSGERRGWVKASTVSCLK